MFLLQRSFGGLAKSFTAQIEETTSGMFEDLVVYFSITSRHDMLRAPNAVAVKVPSVTDVVERV